MWFAIATRQRSMKNKGKTMRVSGSLSGPCSGRGTGDQVASRTSNPSRLHSRSLESRARTTQAEAAIWQNCLSFLPAPLDHCISPIQSKHSIQEKLVKIVNGKIQKEQ